MVPRLDALPRHRHLKCGPPRSRCGARRSFFWESPITDHTDEIRRLNDLTRKVPDTVNATWTMTRGVVLLLTGDDEGSAGTAQTVERFCQLRGAIASFADWPEGNDPYNEHDFGTFIAFGARLFFKIDYYHPDYDLHAPVPSNTELCRRVLTVMRADEY